VSAGPSTFSAEDVDRQARRALVEGRADLDGIDFVEVLANRPDLPGYVPGAVRQRTLLVHLLNHRVPEDWDARRVVVTGGVRPDPRVNPVGVVWAYPALAVTGAEGTVPDDVSPQDRRLVDGALPPGQAARARVFVVRTSTSGDWSTYVLHLLGEGGTGIPAHFDEPLSQAPFTFTVDCPDDLDCCTPQSSTSVPSTLVVDYLARDAAALRTRLLDRLAVLMPAWTDRSPADPIVMLAELFGYLGDRLAYWQDAVAVEAYLGTARRRTSARRHARLVDYAVHEGCSARVLLAVHLPPDIATVRLEAGAPIADVAFREPLTAAEAAEAGAVVVETCSRAQLHLRRNGIPLYSWQDPDHTLPTGTTSAFLAYLSADGDPGLAAGDLLILADRLTGEVPPLDVELGDPLARHAVRLDRDPTVHTDPLLPDYTVLEIHWHPDDALTAPLRVSEPAPAGDPVTRAVALANVVLADHGATVVGELLDPPQVDEPARYRPRLGRPGVAYAQPPSADSLISAAALLQPDPRAATAQVWLDDEQEVWMPGADLLSGSRLAARFVVETEGDGVARLRFGDGVTGRAPMAQTTFDASYRVGGGTVGNVAAGRLTAPLLRPDRTPAVTGGVPVTVWNPLPAGGGTEPEPLEQVRQLAPAAFRHQLRAVTPTDYADVAQSVPGVQRSVARRRWAGSWYSCETTLDPLASRADDETVPAAVAALLELRRTAGRDVEIGRPNYVPLGIEVFACVAVGSSRADVERRLLDVLCARTLADGSLGFFHPDRFTFGQSVFLSDLVRAAMAVTGVTQVQVRRFARLGAPAADSRKALAAGRIEIQPRELVRCDGDPSNPEAGRVDIVLGGGS
jgi:hypothetical protein